MRREIGSEFWQKYSPVSGETPADNAAYLLSGRTALRFIIEDILENRDAKKALLPSYCCDSMIFPFHQAGINVEFYQVHADRLEYPLENDADIVFLLDYFGYTIGENEEIARREKQKGRIVLYDSTHKLDGNVAVEDFADYSFCSYRKWFYCNYAKAVKRGGTFNMDPLTASNARYVQLREAAALEKGRYIAQCH